MTNPRYRVRRSKTKPAIIVVDSKTLHNLCVVIACIGLIGSMVLLSAAFGYWQASLRAADVVETNR